MNWQTPGVQETVLTGKAKMFVLKFKRKDTKIYFLKEATYKKCYGIYKIVNLINGKVYIGQTKESFQRRFWLHRWKLRNDSHDNTHLQRSWNKYGEDKFSFEIVEVLNEDTVESIDEKEIKWIQRYKSKTGVYNIQPGGQPKQLHQYVSSEQRKRTGELNRQRMLGSKLSEETKKKMSETKKGKRIRTKRDTLSDEQAKAIKEMLIDGVSTRKITEILKVKYRSVNNILSNNAYSTVYVEGWDDFVKKHRRDIAKKKKEREELYRAIAALHTKGFSRSEIAKKLNVDWHTVDHYTKKQTSC